jgi:hypothetical protein
MKGRENAHPSMAEEKMTLPLTGEKYRRSSTRSSMSHSREEETGKGESIRGQKKIKMEKEKYLNSYSQHNNNK